MSNSDIFPSRTLLLVLMCETSAATPIEPKLAPCVHVISGHLHTRGATDIVQGEVGDPGVELQQQGQRLSNATSGTEDGDLGVLRCVSGTAVGPHRNRHTRREVVEKARRPRMDDAERAAYIVKVQDDGAMIGWW